MKFSKQFSIVIVTIVLIFIILLGSFFYLQINTVKLEPIAVAYSPFESLTLFWVAQEHGYFKANGLNVTVQKYDSGADALTGVINGEADIAVGTTEFPLVIRALNQEQIKTMASISKSNFIYLVGRSDRGIHNASDLEGKIIGTTFGTIAHYCLGRFLVLNGVNIADVTIVDLKTPSEWVNAVINGSVDAVATAQPYANSAKDGLAANAVVWSINSDQSQYTQAIATNQWITKYPDLCEKFLRALYQAEEFTLNNPSEAKMVIKQQMNFSDAYVETVWAQNQYSLSLDQSLILSMESEARWLITNHLSNQTLIPDFSEFVYRDGLDSVKPETVSIIK